MAKELSLDYIGLKEGNRASFPVNSYIYTCEKGTTFSESQWRVGLQDDKQDSYSIELDCYFPGHEDFSRTATIHLEERSIDECDGEEEDIDFSDPDRNDKLTDKFRKADNGSIEVHRYEEEDDTLTISSLDVYLYVEEGTINTLLASLSPSCGFTISIIVGKVIAPHKAKVQRYEYSLQEQAKWGYTNTFLFPEKAHDSFTYNPQNTFEYQTTKRLKKLEFYLLWVFVVMIALMAYVVFKF